MRYNTGIRGEIVGVLSYSLYTSSSTPYIHPLLLLIYILSYSLYTSRGTPYITPKRGVKGIYFQLQTTN